MKLLALLKAALCSLYQSVKRFPVAIFVTTAFTVLLIIMSRIEVSTDTMDILTRVAMVLALGIPLSLSIALAFERRGCCWAVAYGSYALGALVLALYYFLLLPGLTMVSVTRYMAVSLALYLAFMFVPYFFRRPGFENYVIRVISRFLVTVLYAAVLYIGLSATLLAVDTLLGISVSGTFYYNVWLVVAGVFSPCFFLAGLPGADENLAGANYPTLLRVLLLYIVLPLALTYLVILYLYFFRIVVTLQWPQGTVSHLVLWYSVVCAGVLFLISPLTQDNRAARLFTTWFPRLIIPVLLVMFVAIGIRLQAYGVTENRYFVVALGLWVLGVMLYYSLVRVRNIVLPITLALIALLAVFGPWSAYAVSKYSQNARFEALVAGYNMVEGDSLRLPDREISDADKRSIISILNYFDRSHSLADVRYLPEGFTFADMERVFGFSWYQGRMPEGFISYWPQSPYPPLSVQGYDYLFHSMALRADSQVDDLVISFDPSTQMLVVRQKGAELYARNLKDFVGAIVEKHGVSSGELAAEDLTFVDEEGQLKVKIFFTHVYGSVEDEQKMDIAVEFYLLIGFRN